MSFKNVSKALKILVVGAIGYQLYSQSKKIETLVELQKYDNKIHHEIVEKLKNIRQEFNRMENEMHVNKILSILHSRFQQDEFLINQLFTQTKNTIIPPSFHMLFRNLSLCPNCPTNDWHLESCKYTAKPFVTAPTLTLFINALEIDLKYQILEADPFTILAPDPINPENLCFSEFSGYMHSILNLETKCVKNIAFNPVDDHQIPIIFHSEGCEDDLHSRPIWKTKRCIPKRSITPEMAVQIKHDEQFVYVYCYTQNITILGFEQPCKNLIYQFEKGQNLTINKVATKFKKMKIYTSQSL
uniref:Uncharacterized protein LOC113793799 n=1 Tax=Dermatophagoides pteronyssinus TaxID=6956 RepID=A0A6P6Y3Q0_DERPT